MKLGGSKGRKNESQPKLHGPFNGARVEWQGIRGYSPVGVRNEMESSMAEDSLHNKLSEICWTIWNRNSR